VVYVVRVEGGGVRAELGDAAADVTFFEDYETAAAIARGELAPQQAVMSGRLKVSGDVSALVRNASALRAVEDAFAAARATTSY
jgi:putative sterol carrier protein